MSAQRPESVSEPQPQAAPRLLHTIPQTAHLLSCHEATVWRLIKKGKLPVVRIGPSGGLTRVPDVALHALIQSGKAA